MVTVVLALNLLIALLCLYVAWRIWRVRLSLGHIADILTAAERSTHAALHNAPQAIVRGQTGTYLLRLKYQQLALQLQKVQQILTLLGLGQLAWQRYGRNLALGRSRSFKSSRSRSHRNRSAHR